MGGFKSLLRHTHKCALKSAEAGHRDPVSGVEFLRAGARPATAVVTGFIADHRDRFGVEPICRVLTGHGIKIAPSTYDAALGRAPSKRALSDAALWERIEAIQADRSKGRGVVGYRKMWHLLRRDGVEAARCTVARLMREHGMKGVVRGRKFELATLMWVDWYNHGRLHSSIGYTTPTEHENAYYAETNPQNQPALGEPALH